MAGKTVLNIVRGPMGITLARESRAWSKQLTFGIDYTPVGGLLKDDTLPIDEIYRVSGTKWKLKGSVLGLDFVIDYDVKNYTGTISF